MDTVLQNLHSVAYSLANSYLVVELLETQCEYISELKFGNDSYLHSSQSSVFVQYIHLTSHSHPDVETECQITVCIQLHRV